MAGNNQFYPVATGAGANVLTPASWGASPVRQSGFQSGIAPSSGFNTAWRQSSVIASMVGSFIASAGYDALDNGDLTTLLVNFQSAIAAVAQSGIPGSTALLHSGTDTSSTVNQITLSTVSPDVPSLQDFQVYEIVPASSNTGSVTVTIKQFGSLPLLRRGGSQLLSGDAPAGVPFLAVKYGSSLRMLSAAASEITATTIQLLNTKKIAGGQPFPYATAGTYNLLVTAGTTFSVGECRGAGGGGGGAAGTSSAAAGGGGGGNARKVATASVDTQLSIVVGASGTGGASGGGNGSAGGTTSVSIQSGSVTDVNGNVYGAGQTLCAATGGGGGQGASGTSTATQASPGGVASGGDLNDNGDNGGLPIGPFTNNALLGGLGGGSPASGGNPTANQGAAGNGSSAPGVGGNGSSANATGGNGAPGRVIIYK